jgi:chloramphenicol-sensitive protein RarD
MVSANSDSHNRGVWYAVAAYGLWGLVPLYWKSLPHIAALQMIAHRIVWSCAMLAAICALRQDWGGIGRAARSPRAMALLSAAAVVVGINWFIYVWAVNAGFILQASLGYFITPLVSVLLAVVIFREELRAAQWAAIALAGGGVLYLTVAAGTFPWIALSLAVSFATYGALKKVSPLASIQGLALETAILLIPAVAYLFRIDVTGQGVFLRAGLVPTLLIMAAGPVTTVPLLFFGSAARRIPLSSMGMLQYISPTIQFLIGVLVYREPFAGAQLIGFGLIWTALIIFAVEGYFARQWS